MGLLGDIFLIIHCRLAENDGADRCTSNEALNDEPFLLIRRVAFDDLPTPKTTTLNVIHPQWLVD